MKKSPRYPFDNWFSSKGPTTLTRGRDFNCMPHVMAQQIRNAAFRKRLKVSILIEENNLSLTVKGFE